MKIFRKGQFCNNNNFMRARQSNKCSIGDIITNLISKGSPPPILKQKSYSVCRSESPLAGNLPLEFGQYCACIRGEKSERGQLKDKSLYSPDFKKWLTSTPRSRSRLFENNGAYSNIDIDKKIGIMPVPYENPERQAKKSEFLDAYTTRKRQSSKLEGYTDSSDPKIAARLRQKFQPSKLIKNPLAFTSKTCSQFFPTSHSKQNLTYKINSNFVTLSKGTGEDRPLWRRRSNSLYTTFYK